MHHFNRFGIRRRLLAGIGGLLAGLPARAAPVPSLLVLGDSLSAEYGLARGTGWVALLEARLRQQAGQYIVVNASISGETSRGGLGRLPALLARHRPNVVVLELGANDALRGQPLDALEGNLQAMVNQARGAGAHVLVVGMRIPPNFGRAYADGFQAVFNRVARGPKVGLVPFLLEGFADRLDLFQADHIHPLAAAQGRMLDNVWPQLQPLLRP